jgi:hypothetical protein
VEGERRRRLVRDEATGLVGELMYVGDFEDPAGGHLRRRQGEYPRRRQRLAFLRPEGGGREWTTDPDHVTALDTGRKGAS